MRVIYGMNVLLLYKNFKKIYFRVRCLNFMGITAIRVLYSFSSFRLKTSNFFHLSFSSFLFTFILTFTVLSFLHPSYFQSLSLPFSLFLSHSPFCHCQLLSSSPPTLSASLTLSFLAFLSLFLVIVSYQSIIHRFTFKNALVNWTPANISYTFNY